MSNDLYEYGGDYGVILDCDDNDVKVIEKEINSYNKRMVPYVQDEPLIRLSYKVNDVDGNMIGGIISFMYNWKCVYIYSLFVYDEYRGCGYGSGLLKKIELEAKNRNCNLIHVDTFDFQAKDFYLSNGYKIFGVLKDCPMGHKRYFLKKNIMNTISG